MSEASITSGDPSAPAFGTGACRVADGSGAAAPSSGTRPARTSSERGTSRRPLRTSERSEPRSIRRAIAFRLSPVRSAASAIVYVRLTLKPLGEMRCSAWFAVPARRIYRGRTGHHTGLPGGDPRCSARQPDRSRACGGGAPGVAPAGHRGEPRLHEDGADAGNAGD